MLKSKQLIKLYLKITVLFFFGVVAGISNAEEVAPQTAVEVVENLQNLLLKVMKQGKELGYDGRYVMLDQPVRNTHAVYTIARIVLGKSWKELSDEQKKDFIEIFTRMSIATYAHNFKSYAGEEFKYISEKQRARGGKRIRTVFIESNGNQVQFDYLMRKKADKWFIVNIIADGVSDLALKRSDYTNVLEQGGFDALQEKLEQKIDQYKYANE